MKKTARGQTPELETSGRFNDLVLLQKGINPTPAAPPHALQEALLEFIHYGKMSQDAQWGISCISGLKIK
jgi:hypothetical protein